MKITHIITIPLIILLSACASNTFTKPKEEEVVPLTQSIDTMFNIMKEGNGKKFCIPKSTKMKEIAVALEEYSRKNGGLKTITTPQMEQAFIDFYPC